MPTEARSWRKEKVKKPKGAYWLLKAGRNEERISVSLGYVSEQQAEWAVQRMNAEEQAGTAPNVLALHEEDQPAGVAYLTADPSLGGLVAELGPNYARMPLRDYFKVFSPARAAARPKSWPHEERHWKRILEGLGNERLDQIDVRTFIRWARDLRVETTAGGDRRSEEAANRPAAPTKLASGSYQRLMRSALQACLTYAYLEKHLHVHVHLGEIRIDGSSKAARPRLDPLTLDEVKALVAASVGRDRAMWSVAVGQGLRPSELVRLRWPDVRLGTSTLVIAGDEDGQGKTAASVAEIPLTPFAFRALREWWVAQGQPTDGLVFPSSKDPSAPISSYKKALETCAKKAGITRALNPYLLRHSFATLAWSLGIEKDVARRILRHTDEKMLDEVYCRPRPADLVVRVSAFDL